MANIKLSSHNWETSGIYDLAQAKTQRVINSELNSAVSGKMESTFASGDSLTFNAPEVGSSGSLGNVTITVHTDRSIPSDLTITNDLVCAWIRYDGNTISPVTVSGVSRVTAYSLTIALTPDTALPNAYVCVAHLSGHIYFS